MMTGLTRPDQKDTDQAKTMQAAVFRAGGLFHHPKAWYSHPIRSKLREQH